MRGIASRAITTQSKSLLLVFVCALFVDCLIKLQFVNTKLVDGNKKRVGGLC